MQKKVFLLLLLISSSVLQAQYNHQDIFPTIEGEELQAKLSTEMNPTNIRSYTDTRIFMFTEVYNTNDTVETVYAGLRRYLDPNTASPIQYFLAGNSTVFIDTEHSYPRSKGADRDTDAGSDLHHLFPARQRVNSTRGNVPFGEVVDNQTTSWFLESSQIGSIPGMNIDEYSEFGNGFFEPRESRKGNIARAIFYFYTMYRQEAQNADAQFFDIQRDDLCNWHFEDPVDSLEWERSKMIGTFQGHEGNPFVLDCSLASRLYCEQITDVCSFLTDVDDITLGEEISIFPNPVDQYIKINKTLETSQLQLQIYNAFGKQMMTATIIKSNQVLDLSVLPPGMYILQFQESYRSLSYKIIKL